jgi:hypothetical protein
MSSQHSSGALLTSTSAKRLLPYFCYAGRELSLAEHTRRDKPTPMFTTAAAVLAGGRTVDQRSPTLRGKAWQKEEGGQVIHRMGKPRHQFR